MSWESVKDAHIYISISVYEILKRHILNTLNEGKDFYFIELMKNPLR